MTNKTQERKKAQQEQNMLKVQTEYSNYIYVFASTLNQMVNYIPWKKYDFKEAFALTVTGNTEFDNAKWNTHLSNTVRKTFKEIEITQEKILSIKDVHDVVKNAIATEKLENQPIFFNVTGGQRPFLFAVNKLIQTRNNPNDRICYLEGNTNRLIIMKPDGELDQTAHYYLNDDLTIETALKLMGFDIKEDERRKMSFQDFKDDKAKEAKLYIKLWKKITNNSDLRLKFVQTNKKVDKDKNKIDRESVKGELLAMLPNCSFNNDEITQIGKMLDFSKEEYPFGYVLEKMVGYTLLEAIKDKIVDMSMSESLYFSDKKMQSASSKTGISSIDEFDIAILTKSGKLIVFECKSGAMDGDVAKSTKYSVYAASGVYGKPILVTPLLDNEIKNLSEDTIKDSVFSSIKSAVYSANRATLEVWGLNEIEGRIINLIDKNS